MKKFRWPMVVATALATGTTTAGAQEDPQIADCIEAVGTYLLLRVNDVDGKERLGRMLMSLTNGGHVFFTDSAEVGLYGFQPFTSGRGAWKCVDAEDGFASIKAVVLDFTFATAHDPEAKIARLDIKATYDARQDVFEGETTLRFVPLAGNPFDAVQMEKKPGGYGFTGRRITVPD